MTDDTSRRATLFLALTRPALVFGVPLEAMILNLIVTFFIGAELSGRTLWRSPFMFWSGGVVVHLLLRKVTSWDYHWCRTLTLWVLTATRRVLPSLPTTPARAAREIASCV